MSVILDALRRRRRESTTDPSTRGVPAGLGLTSAVSEVSRRRDRWYKLIAVAATIALLAVWIGLQFTSGGATRSVPTRSAPSQSVRTPIVVPPASPAVPVDAAQANAAVAQPLARNAEPRILNSEPRTPNPAARAAARVDHFALALRYQSAGDFEQAREHYLAVLAANAVNVEARNNLGLLYHGRAMTDDAIDQFTRAIDIDPRYTKARSNLAVVLTSAGRLAEARAQLRAALDAEPGNPDLLVNMALVEKADRHAEQALEILLRAVAASPVHAAAHYNLAVLYEERGSLALALDHYQAFLRQAGPERGTLLADVRQHVRAIGPGSHGTAN